MKEIKIESKTYNVSRSGDHFCSTILINVERFYWSSQLIWPTARCRYNIDSYAACNQHHFITLCTPLLATCTAFRQSIGVEGRAYKSYHNFVVMSWFESNNASTNFTDNIIEMCLGCPSKQISNPKVTN